MSIPIFELKRIIDMQSEKKFPLWIKPPLDLDLDMSKNALLFILLLLPMIEDIEPLYHLKSFEYKPMNINHIKKGLAIYQKYKDFKMSKIFLMGSDAEEAYTRIKTSYPAIFIDKEIPLKYPQEGFLIRRGFLEHNLIDLIADMRCHMFILTCTRLYQCYRGTILNSSHMRRAMLSEYHLLLDIKDLTPYEFCAILLFSHTKSETKKLWMPYLDSTFIKTAIKYELYSIDNKHTKRVLMRNIERHINEKNIKHISKLSYFVVKSMLFGIPKGR